VQRRSLRMRPCQQLLQRVGVQRLDEKLIKPRLERPLANLILAPTAQRHKNKVFTLWQFPNFPCQLVAVHARRANVHNRYIVL
jgi:hypothetical protein